MKLTNDGAPLHTHTLSLSLSLFIHTYEYQCNENSISTRILNGKYFYRGIMRNERAQEQKWEWIRKNCLIKYIMRVTANHIFHCHYFSFILMFNFLCVLNTFNSSLCFRIFTFCILWVLYLVHSHTHIQSKR